MHKNASSESERPLFTPGGFVMVRTPLLPVNSLRTCLERSQASSALLATSEWQESALHEAIEQDLRAIRAHLVEKITTPEVREALLVGSWDLFQAIAGWQQAPTSKKGRQAEINLFRYLTRMTTRPTPFGLFAGVALGSIGAEMDLSMGALEKHRKRTRPDMQWLLSLVRTLEGRAEVVTHIRFFPNPATFISGGRLYIPHLDSYGQAESEKAVSLRATPIVRRVFELAHQGMALGMLKQQVLIERPQASEQQVQVLLDALRQQGALLSDLRPPLTDTNPMLYLVERIKDLPGCADVREQLQSVLQLAGIYDDLPIGKGIGIFQQLYQAAALPEAKLHSTLQVDMRTHYTTQIFSASVANELAYAAEVLLRISTTSPQPRHLDTYRREFIEHYGERREVPLLELLDEEIGLGPPPSYQHPPRHRETPFSPAPEYPERDRILLRLVATALQSRQTTIELDEGLLCKLQVNDSWEEAAPNSLELYASIAAQSQQAINNGNYLLVIGPRIGAQPAGRSFGRFADVLGPDAIQQLSVLLREEESLQPHRLFAELVYLPMHAHAANVAIHPALRKYEVVVGASPGVAREHAIPLNDLVVGLHDERFYIKSLTHNAEIVLSNIHLLNYVMAPNVCRFLAEVSSEDEVGGAAFDWGAATQSPFLPRVQIERIVLCPAQWHLTFEMLGDSEQQHSPDAIWWYQRIQQWRQTWQVPRYVSMVEADNRLFLDLENPLCIVDLAQECWKYHFVDKAVKLQEMLPTLADGWIEGVHGRYLQEFIVPLKRRKPTRVSSLPAIQRNAIAQEERLRLPGSDWLYAKLYCGRTRHDELIAGPMREFASSALKNDLAERWFFIRYADPEPHIRWRFQKDPACLQLLPDLVAWSKRLQDAGLLIKLVIDSYDREIERYGGLEGTRVAEHIFSADSIAVANILLLHTRRTLEMPLLDLAILSVDSLLTDLGLLPIERLQIYQKICQKQQKQFSSELNRLHQTFHTYRKTAQRIIGDRAWLRSQLGGPLLIAHLQTRTDSLFEPMNQLLALSEQEQLTTSLTSFFASCIHMHCNRLFGANRRLEFEVAYYLQRTLESLQRYRPDGVEIHMNMRRPLN